MVASKLIKVFTAATYWGGGSVLLEVFHNFSSTFVRMKTTITPILDINQMMIAFTRNTQNFNCLLISKPLDRCTEDRQKMLQLSISDSFEILQSKCDHRNTKSNHHGVKGNFAKTDPHSSVSQEILFFSSTQQYLCSISCCHYPNEQRWTVNPRLTVDLWPNPAMKDTLSGNDLKKSSKYAEFLKSNPGNGNLHCSSSKAVSSGTTGEEANFPDILSRLRQPGDQSLKSDRFRIWVMLVIWSFDRFFFLLIFRHIYCDLSIVL